MGGWVHWVGDGGRPSFRETQLTQSGAERAAKEVRGSPGAQAGRKGRQGVVGGSQWTLCARPLVHSLRPISKVCLSAQDSLSPMILTHPLGSGRRGLAVVVG